MFFERFDWEEEKLGLISGLSFVLIGVFGYVICFIYENMGQGMNLASIGALMGTMVASGLTAVLFQLPRIKGTRAAISTFLGGIMLGISVILWVITGALFQSSTENILSMVEVFGVSLILLILTFFAIGFLILALYPEEGIEKNIEKIATPEKKDEIEEDIIDRL